MQQPQRRFRVLDLLGSVVSTADMAYWDALGKAVNMLVVQLLGGAPVPIWVYDS